MEESSVRLGELRHALGFLLRLAQQRVFGRFFDAFAEADLGPGAFSVLLGIRENPDIRQGTLAQALMIKRANMAKLVHALEKRGLVERIVPADDRRANLLRLTPEGNAMVERWAPQFFGHDRAGDLGLTAEERRILIALLRKVAQVPAAEPDRSHQDTKTPRKLRIAGGLSE